jgi:hypothetical protein
MLHPDMMAMEARMRHADLQREMEQLRLARRIGQQTAGAYRERRGQATTPPLALLITWVQARLVGNHTRARKRAMA